MTSAWQTQRPWRLEDRSGPRSAERCVSLDSIRNFANEMLHSTFSSAGPRLIERSQPCLFEDGPIRDAITCALQYEV
jgi:hypothetical protein